MRRWLAGAIGAALLWGACGDAAAPQAFPSVGDFDPARLEPGTYHTSVMTPALTMEFGEGWLQLAEYEPLLILSRTTIPGRQADFLNFVTFPATGPDQVIATIRGVQGVVGDDPAPVTVGGREGVEFAADVRLPGGGVVEVFAFPNNALYNQVPLDPPRFADGDRVRFTVVGVGGDTLVVLAGAAAQLDYQSFLAEADAVLATLDL